jgi:uncharacterized membrane protein
VHRGQDPGLSGGTGAFTVHIFTSTVNKASTLHEANVQAAVRKPMAVASLTSIYPHVITAA